MEGLRYDSQACRYIADCLMEDNFTLIDVGCSGGIDLIWRLFGSRLTAFGFDPNISECTRLNEAETLPGVKYVCAFVGLPDNDPIVQRRRGRSPLQRSPWNRLSVARTSAIRQTHTPVQSIEQLTAENQWKEVPLADPTAPVILSDFFRTHSLCDIDMIKIDVDGPDFDILQSLSESLQRSNVLALGLEVNFFGSPHDSDHTFCNTDRFMRAHGFDLFHLTVRPYSRAALPAPYLLPIPAQSQFGQPIQGDAIYARDLGDPSNSELSHRLPPAKLAKLAFIFAAMGLHDCAAELLLQHRDRLSTLLDIDRLLDLLCKEAQPNREQPLSYQDYMAAFERDDQMFYPAKSNLPKFAISFFDLPIFLVGSAAERHNDAVIKYHDGFLEVTTAEAKWSYAVSFDLARALAQGKSTSGGVHAGFAIELELQVSHGQIGVMVVGEDISNAVSLEFMASAQIEPSVVMLSVPRHNVARRLVLRNTATSMRSQFRLISAKLRFIQND